MNLSLSVGYNGSIEDLKRILDSSDKVKSVYTGGASDIIRGGRPQYVESLRILEDQLRLAKRREILFEIALNAPCGFRDFSDKRWWQRLKEYVKELEDMGIDGIIVSHPFLMDLIKSYTQLKITVSTICEIMSARSALFYEELGADVIIPSMNLNMNIAELKLMKRSLKTAHIRLIVNEHCLGDCPWRRFHHAHYSHSDVEIDYHVHCKKTYLNSPYLLLTNNVIRPEDLCFYEHITNDFKIVGRLVPINDLIKRIKAYEAQYFDGNYVELFDTRLSSIFNIPNRALDGLIEKKIHCNKVCKECDFCKELYDSIEKITRR